MSKNLLSDYGSADKSEIIEAVRQGFGVLADASLRPLDQLCDGVIKIAKARLADPHTAPMETSGKNFAVFLLSTELRRDRDRFHASRVPNLPSGTQQLSGGIWLTSPTLNGAARVELTANTLGEAFTEIEGLSLGAYPAIAVEFDSRKMAVYGRGVEDEEHVIRVDMAEDDLLEIPLLPLLEMFAEQFVVTPNCQNSQIKTWNDGGKYHPIQAAEKNIQELLYLFLNARLAETHKIDAEFTLRSGRVDLVIRRKIGEGSWKVMAAIELKVARSYSSTGRPKGHSFLVKHIARGYKQVLEYRNELEAKEGWLLAYDMRVPSARSNDPFAAHRAICGTDRIELKLEPLFGTADDYRDYKSKLPS
jgi:hypothetical protein